VVRKIRTAGVYLSSIAILSAARSLAFCSVCFAGGTSAHRLDRVIPFGGRHRRRTVTEFIAHYHCERNHRGLENELIERAPAVEESIGAVRRKRLGGLLNYYCRSA
jgi:hypothetical protein